MEVTAPMIELPPTRSLSPHVGIMGATIQDEIWVGTQTNHIILCLELVPSGGFLVSLTSRMKSRTLAVNVKFLKIVCLEFVPSDVQMCPEFLPSGGFMVSLTSGVKPQTFAVSVTALKGGASRVVCSAGWVRDLADFRSEATDLHSECYSS